MANLTYEQLTQNIDSLISQKAPSDTIQSYINQYSKNLDGTYSLSSPSQPSPVVTQGGSGGGGIMGGIGNFFKSMYKGAATPIMQAAGTGINAAAGIGGLLVGGAGKLIGNKGVENAGLSFASNVAQNKTMDLSGIGLDKNVPTMGYDSSGKKLSTAAGVTQSIETGSSIAPWLLGAGEAEAGGTAALKTLGTAAGEGAKIGLGFGLGQASSDIAGNNLKGNVSPVMKVAQPLADVAINTLAGGAFGVAGRLVGAVGSFSKDFVQAFQDSHSVGDAFDTAFQNVKTGLFDKYTSQIADAWKRQQVTVGTMKQAARSAAAGKNPQSMLAGLGIDPSSLLEEGKFDAEKVSGAIKSFMEGTPDKPSGVAVVEGKLDGLLKTVNDGMGKDAQVTIDTLKSSVKSYISKLSGITAGKSETILRAVNDELDALGRKYGGTIDILQSQTEKKNYFANSTWDFTKQLSDTELKANKVIGLTLKDSIENIVQDYTGESANLVKELNKVVGGMYDTADYLSKFIGKRYQRSTMGQIGANVIKVAGTALGEQLGGTITAVAGFLGARSFTSMLDDMSSPLRDYILKSMSGDTDQAAMQAVTDFMNKAADEMKNRLQLPEGNPSQIPIAPVPPTTFEPQAPSGGYVTPPNQPPTTGAGA